MLQHVAVGGSVAACCNMLQFVAVCGSVWQCVVVQCSVLQCAALGCRALQCIDPIHATAAMHINLYFITMGCLRLVGSLKL